MIVRYFNGSLEDEALGRNMLLTFFFCLFPEEVTTRDVIMVSTYCRDTLN